MTKILNITLFFENPKNKFLRELSKGVIFSNLSWKLSPGENSPFCCFWGFFGNFSTFFGVKGGKKALKNSKFEKIKISFFPKSTRMMGTKFQVKSSKTVTGILRTYRRKDGHTDRRTYRGPKQGKPCRNWNSSPGSVLVSKHYRFVKQNWLVNITGLYKVLVSGNVPVSLSAFPFTFHYKYSDESQSRTGKKYNF